MVTCALLVSAESLAVNWSTYAPVVLKLALVANALGLLKTTVPGPLNWLQATERVAPDGAPSSVTKPVRLATAGNAIVWSGPALTAGRLLGPTLTIASSRLSNSVSLAESRSVYRPTVANV